MNLKEILFTLLMLCISTFTAAQNISVDVLKFRTLEGNSYADVVIEIPGSICNFTLTDSLYTTETTITVFAEKAGKIQAFQKTSLQSPEFADSTEAYSSTQTHLERLSLPEGRYQLTVEVQAEVKHIATENIEVVVSGAPEISDVAIIEAFAPSEQGNGSKFYRSGFDMVPLAGKDISEDASQLRFYSELYNIHEVVGKDSLFLLVFGLTDSNGKLSPNHTRYKRLTASEAVPVFEVLPVSATIPSPTGGQLVVEARTREGNLIAEKRVDIGRIEFYEPSFTTQDLSFADFWTDADKLYRHLEDHLPLASPAQQHTIMGILKEKKDLELMKSFLEEFWIRQSPMNPRKGWETYTAEVMVVDSLFGSCRSGHGADTDKGYAYLKYGRPNTVVQRHHSTGFYPYEIWHYHRTRGMSNKRFLFYAPHVVGECMEILQSDIPGEIQNEDWLQLLRTRENAVKVSESQLNRLNPRDTYSRLEPEDLYYNPR